mmetsp:Transcript_3322/g.7195  ORF Transcript_3322/g.7195 Transcript_3322/m.7195 type:complete len:96 (+) Transcript_3322:185-472(+)
MSSCPFKQATYLLTAVFSLIMFVMSVIPLVRSKAYGAPLESDGKAGGAAVGCPVSKSTGAGSCPFLAAKGIAASEYPKDYHHQSKIKHAEQESSR